MGIEDSVLAAASSAASAAASANTAQYIAENLGAFPVIDSSVEYPTRALFVAANTSTPGVGLIEGQTALAAGLRYRRKADATGISDLPGWVPNDQVTPAHFGALPRGADGGADQSAAVQASMNYCGAAKVPLYWDAMYLCNGLNQVSDLTCIGIGGGIVSLAVASANIPAMPTTGQHVVTADSKTNFTWDGVIFDNGGNTRFVTGLRTILAYNCTDFEVRNCHFTTQGAAVAAVKCSRYAALNNDVLVNGLYTISSVPTAQHDGIFDQWDGSNNFQIVGNTIRTGNTVGKWPILVTGTDTLAAATRVFNGQIRGNRVQGYTFAGVWIMGRSGGADNFVVSDNEIYGVTASTGPGIVASECSGVVVAGNVIREAGGAGIRVYTEAGGFTPDQSAIVVAGNVIVDANQREFTDGGSGAGIIVRSDTTYCYVGENTVTGTKHVRALFLDGTEGTMANVTLGMNALQPGTTGTLLVSGSIPGLRGITSENDNLRIYAGGLLRLATDTDEFQQRGQTTETQRMFIGVGRTGDGVSELRLTADAAGQNSMSMTAYAGTNGIREIRSAGTGALQVTTTEAAPIVLAPNSTTRVWVLEDGRVGVGASPVASAAFAVTSTTGGVLMPRLTTTQRDAIASPAPGLMIFNTTATQFQGWNGSSWVAL